MTKTKGVMRGTLMIEAFLKKEEYIQKSKPLIYSNKIRSFPNALLS
jgi:hypothetical protein